MGYETSLPEIDNKIKEFGTWLSGEIKVAKIPIRTGEKIELTLPIIKRRGDNFKIYVCDCGWAIELDDDLITVNELTEDGITLLEREWEDLARGLGIYYHDGLLRTACGRDGLFLALMEFIRALLVLDSLPITKNYPRCISNRPAQ